VPASLLAAMPGRGNLKPTAPRAGSPLQHSISINNVPVAMMGPQHGSGKPVSPQPRRGKAAHGSGMTATGAEPSRSLPDRSIAEETVEDAYVQFIFYCNPSLPASSDTTELRRGFQSMPRTDGRTFSAFTLFELIKKLEAREIETWGQLVLELGVKPPDVASGQSTQKVQQYAVRLKVFKVCSLKNARSPRSDGFMRTTSMRSSNSAWANPTLTSPTFPWSTKSTSMLSETACRLKMTSHCEHSSPSGGQSAADDR
jgi:ARS binding protein 2